MYNGSGSNAIAALKVAQPVDAPESPAAIRSALDDAEMTIGQIHSSISHLESRLDAILTPCTPPLPPSATTATQPPPMSSIRSRIGNVNMALNDALGRLAVLRDRIEV